MVQDRSTQIFSMIKWIRTSRLSIKNCLFDSAGASGAEQRAARASRSPAMLSSDNRAVEPEQWLQRHPEAGSSWPSWPKASQPSCFAESVRTLHAITMVLNAITLAQVQAGLNCGPANVSGEDMKVSGGDMAATQQRQHRGCDMRHRRLP